MATFAEVLAEVRDPYVGFLRAVIRSEREQRHGFLMRRQEVAPEVIVAIGDGSNPHRSRFNLPFRPDLLVKKPGKDAKPKVVAAQPDGRFEFAPFEATMPGSFTARFFPFDWHQCDLACEGSAADWQPCLDWFERWFDRNEQRPADGDGLHGVIHEMGEPQSTGDGVAFTVDFGSAPLEALLDLLSVLHAKGMTQLRVGAFFARTT